MPRISIKVQTQRDLNRLFFIQNCTATTQNESDEILNYLTLIENLQQQRYLSLRLSVLKSNWASIVLFYLSKNRFRSFVRMNHFFFDHVVDLIDQDLVLINNSNVSQTFVKNQLKYALYRLRHDDTVNDFLSIADFWEVSKDHVFDCTKRVIKTLCRLKSIVQWSNKRARVNERWINNERQDEFIEVVEKIDDIDIVLIIKLDD
jgi:predicted DNA-binding protein YlxM (UPF0122 family)